MDCHRQVHAGKALDLVTAMIDLNRSVAGVSFILLCGIQIEHSLENEEYEKATDYILKYRHAILTGDINNKDETIMEKAFLYCFINYQSTQTLITALMDQLTMNIEKNKPVQVFRYCSLLDSLGEGRIALTK